MSIIYCDKNVFIYLFHVLHSTYLLISSHAVTGMNLITGICADNFLLLDTVITGALGH